MGDGDQLHGPFPDVFAVQIGDPVFRHDIMDIPAEQGNPGSLPHERNNAGDFPLLGGRLNRQDGFPAGRQNCAAHEIRLAADPAVEGFSQGFGRGLPGQINFQGGVDGGHIVLPGNVQGVVGIVKGPEFKTRVIMDIFIRGSGAPCRRWLRSCPGSGFFGCC